MGGGSYSYEDRSARATSMGYDTKSTREIFTERTVNVLMDPKNTELRESRDSAEHPESVSIVLGLDVTGSMGHIPHQLVKDGLPNIMSRIIQVGIADPQLLFLGIGDHECDRYPLQVGQFESSDELLDKWLTSIYLEGGGGGNDGESYLLAWYLAGLKTSIDCHEKRGQKGFLFTIGDEKTLRSLPGRSLLNVFGNGQYQDYTAAELLDKAREKYHVKHLHLRQGHNGNREDVVGDWQQLMGDDLVIVADKDEIQCVIPEIVAENMSSKQPVIYQQIPEKTSADEEMML